MTWIANGSNGCHTLNLQLILRAMPVLTHPPLNWLMVNPFQYLLTDWKDWIRMRRPSRWPRTSRSKWRPPSNDSSWRRRRKPNTMIGATVHWSLLLMTWCYYPQSTSASPDLGNSSNVGLDPSKCWKESAHRHTALICLKPFEDITMCFMCR